MSKETVSGVEGLGPVGGVQSQESFSNFIDEFSSSKTFFFFT